jgi:thioredoxin 1
MSAIFYSDGDFEEKVLKADKPVLVDFYADWCGPCKMAAPIIEELAGEYDGKVEVGKLDVDANQQTAMRFGVMSIPTVIMFKDGKEVDRQVGFGGRVMYENMIKKVV